MVLKKRVGVRVSSGTRGPPLRPLIIAFWKKSLSPCLHGAVIDLSVALRIFFFLWKGGDPWAAGVESDVSFFFFCMVVVGGVDWVEVLFFAPRRESSVN